MKTTLYKLQALQNFFLVLPGGVKWRILKCLKYSTKHNMVLNKNF